ncbi:hypothetical protein QBC35DRAFT_517477 [Podospora australis]|uniref:Cellobiose dehydrogenase-like cytochrome domain-containing protein n=1 Tax=Podospora australis TaxID=1536484 RepID=A0AAN6WMY5_9PEZI|nr:hypothetical protein QBC35DRAFT_517477 [Podospora australis]
MAHQANQLHCVAKTLHHAGQFDPHTIVNGQTTSPLIDQATAIQFQRFVDIRSNFGFGIALSTDTTSSSFIGQLAFPLANGAGWGGFSLNDDMEGPLLLAAWSDGQRNVISSFRQASNERDNPPEVTGAFSLRPISEATSVNETFLTFTFLCEGCLDTATGLAANAVAAKLGWALANTAVENSSASGGILGFHNAGFGDFRLNVTGARSSEFEIWAALAGEPVSASAGARQFDVAGILSDTDGENTDSDDDNFGCGGGGGAGGGFDTDFDADFDSDTDDD